MTRRTLSRLVFFAALFAANFAAGDAFAGPACSRLFSEAISSNFTASDFPPQHGFPIEARDNQRYSEWAATSANFALLKITKTPVSTVFNQVAKSRRDLQFEIDENPTETTELFGKARTPKSSKGMTPDSDWGISWWSNGKYVRLNPERERHGFARLIMETYPVLTKRKHDGYDGSVSSSYRLRDGSLVTLSSFMRWDEERQFSVKHPTDKMRNVISRDAESIFQDLVDKSNAGHKMTKADAVNFFKATRGWFGSIKYYRGSAAIGRSVIAALYLKTFGKKLRVPKDPYNLDILALIQSEEDFVAALQQYND